MIDMIIALALSTGATLVQNDVKAIATTTKPGVADDETRAILDALAAELQKQRQQIAALESEAQQASKQVDDLTDLLTAATKNAGKDSAGLRPFIAEARRWTGTPYVFGGLTSRGIDCSGLILRVAASRGYRVPHNAALLFPLTKGVAANAMKPGDLVFFRDTYKPGISHVGIYLGQDHFVHAAGTGLGVIVSNLSDPHYQRKFVGARRLEERKVPAKLAQKKAHTTKPKRR